MHTETRKAGHQQEERPKEIYPRGGEMERCYGEKKRKTERGTEAEKERNTNIKIMQTDNFLALGRLFSGHCVSFYLFSLDRTPLMQWMQLRVT